METFYLKDMQNTKLLIFFPTVPQLLKQPRPHQVKQIQDETYIYHYSFYCTVCTEFTFMSHRPVLRAREIGNVMDVSTIDVSFLNKCSWFHIMPKAVSYLFFF